MVNRSELRPRHQTGADRGPGGAILYEAEVAVGDETHPRQPTATGTTDDVLTRWRR
jgi:hypothetical protein